MVETAQRKSQLNGFYYDQWVTRGKELNYNENQVYDFIQRMVDAGLLEWEATRYFIFTSRAINVYEENLPSENVYKNNKIRRDILKFLGDKYNISSITFFNESDLKATEYLNKITKDELLNNLWILEEAHLIEGNFQRMRISLNGYHLYSTPSQLKRIYPTSKREYINLESVAQVIDTWISHQRRKYEESYKAELAMFLRQNGFPNTTEERGDSDADILVENTVPIEIKRVRLF